jgi:gag-polyprotein putative aspartyl protease
MKEFKLVIKPDADDPEAADIFVDGSIGGKPYRFLLDTGAAKTSLAYDDYTATFDRVDQDRSSGVFAAATDDLVVVPALEIGPISGQNVTVARKSANNPDVRTLIGMDLLKNIRCHFCFDESRVLVDGEIAPDSQLQTLFLDRRFHPYVDVHFGASKASAVWDTGAGITIVDMTFVSKHPALFQEVGQSSGTDSTGATMQTPMFIMAESVIGGQTFPPHKVAGVDLSQVNATLELPMDLILGYSTLSKAHWLFDFPDHQWAVLKRLD